MATLADAPPPSTTTAVPTTTALTRGPKDLDPVGWGVTIGGFAAMRTAGTHPLYAAQLRQRVAPNAPSALAALRGGGVLGVYRGLPACVAANVTGEVAYVIVVDTLRHGGGSEERDNGRHKDEALASGNRAEEDVAVHLASGGAMSDALAGFVGDVVATALCHPLQVVSTQQITAGYGTGEGRKYENFSRTVVSLWNSTPREGTSLRHQFGSGIRGLYKGLIPSLCMAPVSAVWWGAYGIFQRIGYTTVKSIRGNKTEVSAGRWGSFKSTTDNPLVNSTAGTAASCVAAIVANPFAVVLTRVQASASTQRKGAVADAVRSIVKDHGVRGFTKGIWAATAYAALGGWWFSLTYEAGRLFNDSTIR